MFQMKAGHAASAGAWLSHSCRTNRVPLESEFGVSCIQALKGTLGFPLIRFEDAVINMYPFTRVHPYETQEIIINDILKHFREVSRRSVSRLEVVGRRLCSVFCVQELISQAAQILGSVDFLGNPMGLLNDVSEGVSELIKYGNVGGLIRSVTHGVSNSAAKVSALRSVCVLAATPAASTSPAAVRRDVVRRARKNHGQQTPERAGVHPVPRSHQRGAPGGGDPWLGSR